DALGESSVGSRKGRTRRTGTSRPAARGLTEVGRERYGNRHRPQGPRGAAGEAGGIGERPHRAPDGIALQEGGLGPRSRADLSGFGSTDDPPNGLGVPTGGARRADGERADA